MTDISDIEKMEDLEEENIPLTKPKKPRKQMEKKPRTEAQIKAFQVAQQRLKEVNEKRKIDKQIEASKLLLGLNNKPVAKPKPVNTVSEVSSSSEEEIILKKATKLPAEIKKKKKRRVIVMEDSSSEEDDTPPQPKRPEPRHTISQQNKKSIIKVHQPTIPEKAKQNVDYNNFFC
jgi:hypothetical protein